MGYFLYFFVGVFGIGVDVRKFDGFGILLIGWLVCFFFIGKGVVLFFIFIGIILLFFFLIWMFIVLEELLGIVGIDDKLYVVLLLIVLL